MTLILPVNNTQLQVTEVRLYMNYNEFTNKNVNDEKTTLKKKNHYVRTSDFFSGLRVCRNCSNLL